MFIKSEFDLNVVCRTCLSIGEMKSLYEKNTTDLCLVEMLISCTSVKYYGNDNLPTQICLDCVNEINRSYKFAIKCRETENKLQEYLQSMLNPELELFKNGEDYEIEHAQHLSEENNHIENICLHSTESHSQALTTTRKQSDSISTIDTNRDLGLPVENIRSELSKISNETISSLNIQNGDFIWLKNEVYHENEHSLPIVDIPVLKVDIKVENVTELVSSTRDILELKENKISEKNNRPAHKPQSLLKTSKLHQLLTMKSAYGNSEDKQIKRVNSDVSQSDKNNKMYSLRSYTEYKNEDYQSDSSNSDGSESDLSYKNYSSEHSSNNDDESDQSNNKNSKTYCKSTKLRTGELVPCTVCGKLFTLGSKLNFHMMTHTKEETYSCFICEESFKSPRMLKIHGRKHTNTRERHKCQICDYPFRETTDLEIHMKVHTNINPLSCSFCGENFMELKSLRIHMQSHDNDKPYSCSKCDLKFAKKVYLLTHEKIHTDIKRHKCDVCGRAFRKAANLKSHMVIHTNVRPHSCSICDKSFTIKYRLEAHKRTHNKDRPFSCMICNHAFGSKPQLTKHMSVHAGACFECSICGKKFTVNQNLQNHIKIHTDEKKQKCQMCDSSFKTKRNLYKHMQNKHPKGDPVVCTLCNRSFTSKERLRRHTIIHKTEKPFECSVCNKSFRDKASLKQHMPTHSNLRSHLCTVCDKAFKLRQHLSLHMRTHIDERPFACTLCDFTFKLQHHLKAHLKSKHSSND